VAVGGVAALVGIALWTSAGMAVAVMAIGLGATAWRWQRARQRTGSDLAHDELARLWSPLPVSVPPSDVLPLPRTLPALLTAEAGLTRRGERTELVEWCTDPAALPVRVLAGVGGAGKSRLAVDLARALPKGWTAGVARPGRAARIVQAATAVAAGSPVRELGLVHAQRPTDTGIASRSPPRATAWPRHHASGPLVERHVRAVGVGRTLGDCPYGDQQRRVPHRAPPQAMPAVARSPTG
jgi:hypothetical protein